jgi:hypothetical protein
MIGSVLVPVMLMSLGARLASSQLASTVIVGHLLSLAFLPLGILLAFI